MGKLKGSFVVRLRSAIKPLDWNILRWRQAGRCLLRSSTGDIEIPRFIGQNHGLRLCELDPLTATESMCGGRVVFTSGFRPVG